jgi:hypothetical protein
MTLTFPNGDLGAFRDFWKLRTRLQGVKTPRLEVFFILLERSWSANVENGLAWAIGTSTTQVMCERKAGSQIENRPNSLVCRWRATWCWKALDEGYNFSLNLIAIRGPHKKLGALKVAEALVVAISGLPFGSPETKSHLDVALMEWHKVYYIGGRWWLPPSLGRGESYESKVACGSFLAPRVFQKMN